MKALINILMALTVSLNVSACSTDNENPETPQNPQGTSEQGNPEEEPSDKTYKVKLSFGNNILTATLIDNATTRAFIEKLPVTLPMQDLYSREMCYHFPEALPANEVATRGYDLGEIIYWTPGRSFVIMYKQNGERFAMQNMGRIDSGVEIFSSTGDLDVRFELIENK